MSPPPDSTLADPQQIIADLRRELAECLEIWDQGHDGRRYTMGFQSRL